MWGGYSSRIRAFPRRLGGPYV